MSDLIMNIASSMHITKTQVENTLKLLEEGCTVPFIARYRKEMTNALDEEQIQTINEQYKYQVALEKRKEDVIRLIETQGKLTDTIKNDVLKATKMSEVDDIYRPYQQKKKTRAAMAIALGLEPLANYILENDGNVINEAKKYINDDVKTIKDAIKMAQDIIAEKVSDHPKIRWIAYDEIMKSKRSKILTKVKKDHNDEQKVYQMYYEFSDTPKFIANHRIMAIDRAEKEKVISVSFDYNKEFVKKFALSTLLHGKKNDHFPIIEEAVEDGLKRLLFPSVEREARNALSERAQKQSIEIFSMNLEKLLLQSPISNKWVLGFDPAFRTGCKLAVIDPSCKMITIDVIYPHMPVNKVAEAEKKLVELVTKYPIEIIAIGNGTASRESESFVANTIKKYHLNVVYTIVSEAGASVYSASELARAEFPDLTVEKRSAVSIARRVIDPLAELIKIDPKSIGVGQYQHDLPEKELTEKLDFAVLKSVNRVGVDLNTASIELLMHVSGLNKTTAKMIVEYRNENGLFTNRNQLKKVKKLGEKSFTQCAGFLRIHNGENPFDETAIHPESYELATKIMNKYHMTTLGEKFPAYDTESLAKELKCDSYTLKDIISAIEQPLRDYREAYDGPVLRSDVLTIDDLRIGQCLEGVVRNVVDFGAFVDIGLHEDGLIHISKMSKERITHPSEVLSVNDIITVYVLDIDKVRNRVQLGLFMKA